MFVFLDESGDLGFDFTKGGTSRFFVITILVVENYEDRIRLFKAVERTIKNKVRKGKKNKTPEIELKGTRTSAAVKAYFFRQLDHVKFQIYSLVLNKARVYEALQENQAKLYNYIARLLIQKCPFQKAKNKIILTLDKSKDQEGIKDFNRYLLLQLQSSIPASKPVEIFHVASHENKGVQAADLFSWGIFRKHERKDAEWYNQFRGRIRFEEVYLK
jgi:hypothetical protein